jgi:teichuronic acid biosynthesis glycosyltransferase TuaH
MTAAGERVPRGDWDGLIVLAASTPWGGHGLPDLAVAKSLTRYAPVLYVDPPISPITARRHPQLAASAHEQELRRVDDRVMRLTPRVPPAKERPGMKTLVDLLTRRAMRRAVDRLGRPTVRAVVVSSFNPLFGACGEDLRVFYAEDDYVAGAALMGIAPKRLRRAEARQLADADLVVAASAVLAERFRARGCEPLLMANGCDPDLGAVVDRVTVADDVELSPPIAIVLGCLNDRLDHQVLTAVADSGLSLLLVGPRAPTYPERMLSALTSRANVQWVGARTPGELPGYLRAAAVGLVPYQLSAFNRASFPLKTLEYLSSGLPVVATDLPAVRWLETDLVRVVSTPQAFAAAAVEATRTVATSEEVRTRRAFAELHSWDSRVDRLAAALGLDVVTDTPRLAASGSVL